MARRYRIFDILYCTRWSACCDVNGHSSIICFRSAWCEQEHVSIVGDLLGAMRKERYYGMFPLGICANRNIAVTVVGVVLSIYP